MAAPYVALLPRRVRRGLDNMKIQSYLTAAAVNLKRLSAALAAMPSGGPGPPEKSLRPSRSQTRNGLRVRRRVTLHTARSRNRVIHNPFRGSRRSRAPFAMADAWGVNSERGGVVEKTSQVKNACGAFAALAHNTSLVPNRSGDPRRHSSLIPSRRARAPYRGRAGAHRKGAPFDTPPLAATQGEVDTVAIQDEGNARALRSTNPPSSVGKTCKRSFLSRV